MKASSGGIVVFAYTIFLGREFTKSVNNVNYRVWNGTTKEKKNYSLQAPKPNTYNANHREKEGGTSNIVTSNLEGEPLEVYKNYN